jgi:hypothetical protein
MGRLKGWFCGKKKKKSCTKSTLYLEEKRFQMVIFRHKFLRFKHKRFIFYSALGASQMCNQIWLRPRRWSPAHMYLTEFWKKKSWPWIRDPKKEKPKTKNAKLLQILNSLLSNSFPFCSHEFWEWIRPYYLLHVVFWHGYFCIILVYRSLFLCTVEQSL